MSEKFFLNIASRSGKILHRYIENGERKKEIIDFQPSLYIKASIKENVVTQSLKDELLEPVTFTDHKEMRDFIKDYKDIDGFSIYGSDNLVTQFTSIEYPGNIVADASKVRMATVDIETFSGSFDRDGNYVNGPFPKPENCELYPVVMVSLTDKSTGDIHTFALEEIYGRYLGTYVHNKEHDRIGKKNIIYKGFKTEREMLSAFLSAWEALDFDAWTGWSIESFDNPYLIGRIIHVLGKSAANRLSPWGSVNRDTIKNDYGGEEVVYDIVGIEMLDYKALFKKHGFMNPLDYKLHTVANLVLGKGKLDYDAKDPNELYVKDFQKAVEYNIVDNDVVDDIDRKMGLLGLTCTLAYMTKSNYKDTLGTVKPWNNLLFCMLSDRKIFPEIKSIYQGDTKFAGGFVRAVDEPGRRRWVVSCDLNSLN